MNKKMAFTPKNILILASPLALFPVIYFPYRLWLVRPFGDLVRRVLYASEENPMWVIFNVSETIIYFWLVVSIVVMLSAAVIAALRVRPWYFIPLYLAVMFSFCGIFSLALFRFMV